MIKTIALFFSLLISLSFGQVLTVSAEHMSAVIGDSVIIPIDITGLTNVGAITIIVQYDPLVLTWGRALNWNNELNDALAGGSNGSITIAWDNALDPANISNGKLVELKFLYNGGYCPISFIPDEITDLEGNPFQVNYSPGSVDEYHLESPSHLDGFSLEEGKINLKWRDNSDNETGFVIERADSNSYIFSEIGNVTYNICWFEDNNVNENQRYCYRVKSYNINSQSYYSNSITVLAPISRINAPTDLLIEPDAFGNFHIYWKDNSNNENGFIIERLSQESSMAMTDNAWDDSTMSNIFVDTLQANSTSYIDSTVREGQTYEYRIFGFNHEGISPTLTDTSTTPIMPLIAPSNFLIKLQEINKIVLTWKDNSQYEKGFKIERSIVQDSGYYFVDTVGANITQYADTIFESKTKYYYRICAYNGNGISAFIKSDITVGIDKSVQQIPSQFDLFQNYPNPFNPTTTISFNLPTEGRVAMKVYDIMGREVITLLDEERSNGLHSVVWNSKNKYGSDVASGIYLYNITFKDKSLTKKIMLMK